jgi:hypothetical protein
MILEDPPLFSSVGEKRFNYYNYNDLSTICHNFINQEEEDFVYYYVMNQYMRNFFPENPREKIREKSGKSARKYRKEHPDKPLKIRFWPKKFLKAFNGWSNMILTSERTSTTTHSIATSITANYFQK